MLEKKKKTLTKEHFEVLLEDIDKKVALVLEGHDVLNKKIDNLSAETKERDDHLEFLIHAVNGKIDKEASAIRSELKQEIGTVRSELKEEIRSVKQELGEKIDKEVGVVRSELKEAKQELGEKIDKVLEKIENHETRIVRLEEKVLS